MDEEHCPNCHKHCHKDNLHCDRGRKHFGVPVSAPNGDLLGVLAQVEKQFKACGDKTKFFNCLTDCEREILIALLNKVKNQNETK